MKLFLLLVALTCVSACASVSADEDFCKENIISFNVPNFADQYTYQLSVPQNMVVSASTQINLADAVKNINDIGNVDAEITKNILTSKSGSFDWANHITIQIRGVSDTINYPTRTLVDQDLGLNTNPIDLQSELSGNIFYNYLSQGNVEFTFGLTTSGKIPEVAIDGSVNITHNICMSAHINIDKHL